MGANRINVTQKVDHCGAGMGCELYGDCPGHTIQYQYNSVVDISTITVDGEVAFSGGTELIYDIAKMIVKAEKNYRE